MTSVIPEIAFPISQKNSDGEIVASTSFGDDGGLETEFGNDRQLHSPSYSVTQLSQGHHVNLQDKSGKSLLIHSCVRGLKSTVEELSLDENIDVNLEDSEGNTALIHAAQAGYTQIVELLIDRFDKLEIDHVNKLGQTALIKAAIQGRANCARILLRAGADPYRRDNGRQLTALEWAKFVGRTECGRLIGEFVAPRRSGGKQSLQNSAQDNFKQVACLAVIPLIGGGVRELPALSRPRLRSAPPTPVVKIQITPPSSPFCQTLSTAPTAAEGHPPKQFPFKAIAKQNHCLSSKKRPLRTPERAKSSAM
uniref:ANK_REP_REGION domain-containing protein n=1 Tax=Globodera pallida TaxID=36090 RepID=A0A183CLD6_GLOPA